MAKAGPSGEDNAEPDKPQLRICAGTYEASVYGLRTAFPTSSQESAAAARIATYFACAAHVGPVKCVAASSNGGFVVSGGVDETIRIYNTKKLVEYGALHRHRGAVTCLEFFESSHLLSAGEDGKILVWDVSRWLCLARLRGHEGAVNHIAIHPSGKVALSVGKDKTLRMWNLLNGSHAHSRNLPYEGKIVRWDPAGENYAIAAEKQITLFNAEARIQRVLEYPTKVLVMSYLEANLIIAAGEDTHIYVHNVSTGELVATVSGHQARLRGLSVTKSLSGAPILASASTDGIMLAWDLSPIVNGKPETAIVPFARTSTDARITAFCIIPNLDSTVSAQSSSASSSILSSASASVGSGADAEGEVEESEEEDGIPPPVVAAPVRVAKKQPAKKQKAAAAAAAAAPAPSPVPAPAAAQPQQAAKKPKKTVTMQVPSSSKSPAAGKRKASPAAAAPASGATNGGGKKPKASAGKSNKRG